MTYKEQLVEIIKHSVVPGCPALPTCGGQCSECEYRAKEWKEILGEPLVGENNEPLFYYEEK